MPQPPLFPTQIVGSWSKPKWLANHEMFFAPENTWWRVPEEQRPEALDDATLLAIYDQERAGLTYVTDGEQRRQTFSGYFNVLGGVDNVYRAEYTVTMGDIGNALKMKSKPQLGVVTDQPSTDKIPAAVMFKATVPQVTGPVTWPGPILGRDLAFLKSNTTRLTKMTIIGSCSLSLRLADAHYGSQAKMAFGIADALNAELRYLQDAGVDVLQIDEPEAHFRYSQCKDYVGMRCPPSACGSRRTAACGSCPGSGRWGKSGRWSRRPKCCALRCRALRLHAGPEDGLRMIGKHLMPAVALHP